MNCEKMFSVTCCWHTSENALSLRFKTFSAPVTLPVTASSNAALNALIGASGSRPYLAQLISYTSPYVPCAASSSIRRTCGQTGTTAGV